MDEQNMKKVQPFGTPTKMNGRASSFAVEGVKSKNKAGKKVDKDIDIDFYVSDSKRSKNDYSK